MSPLAIAIAKGLTAAVALFIAIWLIRRDGYLSGYSQGRLDAVCGTETDEHEKGLPQ